MVRKPLIAGNWKMNKTVAETKTFVAELKAELTAEAVDSAKVEMVVCPPFLALEAATELLKDTPVTTGAQNMHWETAGAYTGEVAGGMLYDLGVTYVIIGHSERRQFFGETDAGVNLKIKAALQQNLKPIICVGEKLEEREAGHTQSVVQKQLLGGLQDLSAEQAAQLVIAYEPVWAIGTGKTASSADAQAVCGYIRELLTGLFGEETAAMIRIQYGGSVKPANAAELLSQPDIDGALVGGASLKVPDFMGIIRSVG